MDDLQLHAGLIGQSGSRDALNTPVLVLDRDKLERNIALMAARVTEAGVNLRPHAKTHKSIDIARLQIEAGAIGLCCAKIGEAEVMADGGIEGILITSPVAAPAAVVRLAKLAARSHGLAAVVDSAETLPTLQDRLAAESATLDVLIDVDPGIRRTGVASAQAAIDLARAIGSMPNLKLRGLQFYCGAHQHIESFEERRAQISDRTDYLKSVIGELSAAGYPPEIVSGSGTGTHSIDLGLGVFTEIQAGSYVFMDAQYLACDLQGDASSPFEVSLAVDARVVSANHAELVTLDAGFKALSTDGGKPFVLGGAPAEAGFAFMGDEHGALIRPGIGGELRPGARVTLAVPHCDPTVNLYDHYHVVQGDRLIAIWPISARGRAR